MSFIQLHFGDVLTIHFECNSVFLLGMFNRLNFLVKYHKFTTTLPILYPQNRLRRRTRVPSATAGLLGNPGKILYGLPMSDI